MNSIGEGVKIDSPIFQYNETDWELIKRLASNFNSVIACDIIYYEIESGDNYALGDEIKFKQKKIYVSQITEYIDKGLLKYKYRLSRILFKRLYINHLMKINNFINNFMHKINYRLYRIVLILIILWYIVDMNNSS